MSFAKGRLDLGDSITANGSAMSWMGGKGLFIVEATTWGTSAEAYLELQSPNGTWVPVSATQMSENGAVVFELPPGDIRIGIGGTITAAYAYAVHIGE